MSSCIVFAYLFVWFNPNLTLVCNINSKLLTTFYGADRTTDTIESLAAGGTAPQKL